MRKVTERNRQKLDYACELLKKEFDVDVHIRPCRKQAIVRAKACLINVAIRNMGIVLEQVADYLGYVDHTSVLHHRDNHHDRFKSDLEYADIYLYISREVNPGFDAESREVFTLLKAISA